LLAAAAAADEGGRCSSSIELATAELKELDRDVPGLGSAGPMD
jgi:hypothetical protein